MVFSNTCLKTSLQLSGCSLTLAVAAIVLAQHVNYLNYLLLFNTMALVMVSAGMAAVLIGLLGTWQTRGRNAALWFADTVALLAVISYVFNP